MKDLPKREGTLSEVLSNLENHGYGSRFVFSDGKFRCIETNRWYGPRDLTTEAIYRFEGPSNPSDMSIVYALRASDGTGGVFVDAFGPTGDSGAAEFLEHAADVRCSGEA